MSNGSGQKQTGAALPASQPGAPAAQPAEQPDEGGRATPREPVPLKGSRSLERLRDRVKRAAQELARLRKENAAMTDRIRELETRPAVDFSGTALAFEEDPEALRRQVERFIEAIDAYLAIEKEEG